MFFFMYALILVFLFFSSMKVKNEVEIDSVCTSYCELRIEKEKLLGKVEYKYSWLGDAIVDLNTTDLFIKSVSQVCPF